MKPGEPLCCTHLLHKRLWALDSPHPYLHLAAALWVCTPIALRQACYSRSKNHHKDPRGWSRTINWGDLHGDLLGSLSVWNALKHPKDSNKPVLGSYAILIVDRSIEIVKDPMTSVLGSEGVTWVS